MYKLGDKILFNHKLVKDWVTTRRRNWIKVKIKESEGIVVGIRTLSNGYIDYDSYGEGIKEFNRTGIVKALLVVTSLKKAPFYIPFKLMNEETEI